VTPKPPVQLTLLTADEIRVGSCHQDEVPQTPVTPVTPVSAEGLASLQNLIKQDAHTLDDASSKRLERHVQKLAYAAQISFANGALLNDRIQILAKMNDEAKVRKSTRSVVLGKAKVMSFEDIEVARAARAAKEATKGKGKRGRKRKNTALEEDEPEAEAEVESEVAPATKEAITDKRKRSQKRKSAAQEAYEPEPEPEVAQVIEAPKPWRAPVARMYPGQLDC